MAMSDRRQQWRRNRDWHFTDEELARAEVAAENEAAVMPVYGLTYCEDELPPIASEAEPQERRY